MNANANTNTTPSMTGKAWLMLITLSILWGGSFFFVEVAVNEVPTFTLVLFRVGLGALGLWGYLLLRRRALPMNWTFWWPFFVMAFLNNVVPFTLIVWGQSHIASGLASILNAATPFFTVILASLLISEERFTINRIVGVIIGFFGVAILIGPDFLATIGDSVLAQLACLGAAVSYAFAGVFARKSTIFKARPADAATAQLTAAAILILPVAIFADGPATLALPSMPAVASILGLGFLATSIAYVLYFRILATAGAVNLLLVTFLVPVTAVVLGVLVLGEVMTEMQILGAIGIAIALSVIDGRPIKFLKSFTSPHRRNAS
jgi:drug/metabolite transporter (DMT)-like permease